MQTPYLIIDKRWTQFVPPAPPSHRQTVRYDTEHYLFLFFPPANEGELRRFEQRVHLDGNTLRYEDGFMLRYPDAYVPRARDKLELFDLPSIELDGFYSRVCADGDRITVDGSGMYLQTLCSHESAGRLAFSNNLQLLENALHSSGVQLTRNELFFANHFFNHSLAYHASAGTPWEQIRFHDSLETITLERTVRVELRHKFNDERFSVLSRQQRIELLLAKLRHAVNQYCCYLDVHIVGHNLTGGRDSRTSFAIFLGQVRDKLEVVTNGPAHTQDCVISNYVAERFGLRSRAASPASLSAVFDYANVMKKIDLLEWMTPLFKKMRVSTEFDSESLVANGYLGNVTAFDGGEKNLVVTDNRFCIDEAVEKRLMGNFRSKVDALTAVYGERAYAMFNVMYNMTNKIESVHKRLKSNTFCIFEFDFFQLCYAAETTDQRRSGALHHDLLLTAEPSLLTSVPFETNKSFDSLPGTFELTGSSEALRPALHRVYLQEHQHRLVDHLLHHRNSLGFMADGFFDLLVEKRDTVLPPQFANKIYAALGTLEFQGIEFDAEQGKVGPHEPEFYSRDFFERFYLDRQIWVSGLAGMVYSPELVFKCCVDLPEHLTLRIVVRHAQNNSVVPSTLEFEDGGHLLRAHLPVQGKYRVNISAFDPACGTAEQRFATTFVAKWAAEAISPGGLVACSPSPETGSHPCSHIL